MIVEEPLSPAVAAPAAASPITRPAPESVGTAGRNTTSGARRPVRVRSGAANAIYVEFDHARWFTAGPPISLDARSLTRVGESHGFPVYAAHPGDSTIYVPIAQGMDTVAPYSKRR